MGSTSSRSGEAATIQASRSSSVKYSPCWPPSMTNSVATQATPPVLSTRAISRTDSAALSCPPKCSMELSE